MSRIKLADLGRQHGALMKEIGQAVLGVIERGDFILGKEVSDFENEFAAASGARFAIGVDNGTSALELIMRALGVRAGDEVIVPAFTFVATAYAVRAAGATPVFADVDPETGIISDADVSGRLTSRTRAVIAVHLYGYPADLTRLSRAAGKGRHLIEDACQAHGARAGNGKWAGTAGKAGAFSFYPSKNLGGIGDGGMVVTDDDSVAETVRSLRNYGQAAKYEHVNPAFNRRLDSVQAAVLRVKLKRLDGWNDARREAASHYRRALADTSLKLAPDPENGAHAYYTFTVRSSRRDALAKSLAQRGIETGIHYPRPLHLLPVFADLGHERGSFPEAERLADEVLSLPMFPGITAEEIESVATAVREFEAA